MFAGRNSKHLMTVPMGNSDLCSYVSEGEENIEAETNLPVSRGDSH